MSGGEHAAIKAAAQELARGAGAILLNSLKGTLDVSHKDVVDLVTNADLASEAFLVGEITRRFPTHAILAEESGLRGAAHADAPFRWVIDPLDGTTNFAHRLPCFSVLLGVEALGPSGYQTVIGVTFDPVHDELFFAERGQGAFCNGQPIHVSSTERLLDGLFATGFAVDRLWGAHDNHREFCRMSLVGQAMRRFGSAGIDLAWVACGRLDGFWEWGLHAWDMTAGALLIAEAGGVVTQIDGAAFDPSVGSICTANRTLHPAMLAALASSLTLPANARDGIEAFLPAEAQAKLWHNK